MGFKIIEDIVSGDFVFEATGKTIDELFKSCAEACFSAMTDIEGVDAQIEHSLELDADSLDDLLVVFLSELVYLKDTEKVFFSKFEIKIDNENNSLKCVAWGDRIDYGKHEIRSDVKAATYHNLKIEKFDDKFKVKVILDL
jgi:SHS2 domain-containing protein